MRIRAFRTDMSEESGVEAASLAAGSQIPPKNSYTATRNIAAIRVSYKYNSVFFNKVKRENSRIKAA